MRRVCDPCKPDQLPPAALAAERRRRDRAAAAGTRGGRAVAGRPTNTSPGPVDQTAGERMRRVAERRQVVDVRLPACAVVVEDHRMEVDPARGRRRQLHPGRAPVGLHAVVKGLEGAEGSPGSGRAAAPGAAARTTSTDATTVGAPRRMTMLVTWHTPFDRAARIGSCSRRRCGQTGACSARPRIRWSRGRRIGGVTFRP